MHSLLCKYLPHQGNCNVLEIRSVASMSIKNIIVVCFIVAIAVCSGYFLYQIDLHEKALLGQAWINPVPNDIWQKYLVDKQTHEENVKSKWTQTRMLLN
jgi:hypothetical protein